MINWNFPPNNYGQVTGLNDAGIETFKGNPWDSLAREINQNSCDARVSGSIEPVRVEFEVKELPASAFPRKDMFINVLNQSLDYWKENAKTVSFFEQALNVMQAETIKFLKISDYNTTGLTGANQGHHGGWHNLIKSVGSSNKDSKSGGSFGIGKHAPFACSDLRTVFYSTKDQHGVEAFQGVSKLVTHYDEKGEPTQGTGYYGQVEKNEPILLQEQINEFFRRDETGTDVFIAGFNAEEEWETKVIRSVLESFFVAILDQKLIVKVGETEINAETIPSILGQYTKGESDCLSYSYYEAYTLSNTSKFVLNNFEGFGEIRMYILPGKDAPKRVAMVRSTGMKIYDKGSFRTPFKFSGVLIADGDEINEFLRKIEPPTHTAWEAERHDDPNYAKGIIKKLYGWMNEQIRSISLGNAVEELDVEGLSEYLPDKGEDSSSAPALAEEEGEKSEPKEIELQVNYQQSKPNTVNITSKGDLPGYDHEQEAEESDLDSGVDPDINKIDSLDNITEQSNGEKDSEEHGPSDSNHNDNSDEDNNTESEVSGEEKQLQPKVNKNLRITQSRIFCTDPGKGTYKMTLKSNEGGYGYVGVNIIGEVGGEKAKVRSAEQFEENVHIENDVKIGPVRFDRNERTVITITLKEPLRCALEVAIYAN
ncbi:MULTISPECIES: hypothetical protein [Paenibacillus]|uniref:hypothetical protein n=1 Tax=Paenibacillus TaxID=44249 RepID=UPI001C64AD46|nr:MULTISPECIES: hypothetical protein [Paenibacillus]QYK65733.1 hypothetical protein KAI36_00869 [Paenibacillus sp. S02]WCM62192.1 hypothetical protein OYT09_04265 [Paenibacillus polymyxa]